jgi:hypothetical protein
MSKPKFKDLWQGRIDYMAVIEMIPESTTTVSGLSTLGPQTISAIIPPPFRTFDRYRNHFLFRPQKMAQLVMQLVME